MKKLTIEQFLYFIKDEADKMLITKKPLFKRNVLTEKHIIIIEESICLVGIGNATDVIISQKQLRKLIKEESALLKKEIKARLKLQLLAS